MALFFGYSTIITLFYIFSTNVYIYAIYNIYFMILLILPFLLPIKLPHNKQIYPKLICHYFLI